MKIVAEALKSNHTISTLGINYHLEISENSIGDDGAKAVGDMLRQNSTLTDVCMIDYKL